MSPRAYLRTDNISVLPKKEKKKKKIVLVQIENVQSYQLSDW